MRAPTPLRRELLFAFGALFAGAVLIAGLGFAALYPVLGSLAQGVLFLSVLVVADLAILFLFGRALLQRSLVAPMEALAGDARRIAGGDYHHRAKPSESLELDQLSGSINAMADRLIADQELLAENVASLDGTNEELVIARDQVVHAARLASVGTLAAGIAHEVGNPLGAIMAYVDVARSRAARSGAETELLESIREEARRIDRIVRGLLDYARPREAEPEPAAPAQVLAKVRELLDNQGKLDDVTHAWVIAEDVPDVVMEPHRLEQVMVNLLLNALDALSSSPDPRIDVTLSAEGGEVTRLPKRRADDPPGINYMHRRRVSKDDGGKGIDPLFTARRVVVIEVRDNGPGIPEERLETVFDPFFTTKEPGKGTGLGLSICARLVEGMGGRIQASNVSGGGACFTIRLPGVPEADEAADERARGTEAPE
ncbi:MAG: HAMP domain-containing protein [Gemmatimonadetes bacterium]|nr:HAMP domain-containing protein [Gemmatimonadota bacterium]